MEGIQGGAWPRRGPPESTMSRQTVGQATGIWDSLEEIKRRLGLLTKDLDKLKRSRTPHPVEIQALEGRISELNRAASNPNDRRVFVRYYVERFAFDVTGAGAKVTIPAGLIGGEPDTVSAWSVAFWMGAWAQTRSAATCRVRLRFRTWPPTLRPQARQPGAHQRAAGPNRRHDREAARHRERKRRLRPEDSTLRVRGRAPPRTSPCEPWR